MECHGALSRARLWRARSRSPPHAPRTFCVPSSSTRARYFECRAALSASSCWRARQARVVSAHRAGVARGGIAQPAHLRHPLLLTKQALELLHLQLRSLVRILHRLALGCRARLDARRASQSEGSRALQKGCSTLIWVSMASIEPLLACGCDGDAATEKSPSPFAEGTAGGVNLGRPGGGTAGAGAGARACACFR